MSNNIFHHEEIYRGKEIMKMLASKHLTVCGAGAIGSNLVDNLTRQGFKSFRVIDFDRVDRHNINNQIYHTSHVGLLKASALTEMMCNIDGNVEPIFKKLEDDNIKKFIKNTDLVVDAFDNISSRKLVRDYCAKNHIPCVHTGVLINFGEVQWNDNYKLNDEQSDGLDPCDYPLARNIVISVVILASEIIIDYFVNKKQRNAIVTLDKLNVRWVNK